MKNITAENTQTGLQKFSLVLAAVALLLSSCQSTRPSMYQGTPPDNKGIAQTSIHERNFQIWLKNQTAVKGMVAFNSTSPCPDAMGHGR